MKRPSWLRTGRISLAWLSAALLLVIAIAAAGTAWLFFREPQDAARQSEVPGADIAGPPLSGIPFRVPPGFEAEQVAGPPLVVHPMFACFDDEGRLYVAGSSGHNAGPKELLANPPDVIRRLEDTDDDGVFDRSTVFADKLTYPQGVLWHDGAVFTASPPSLWRLEDRDGDGVADHRSELANGFPFTGIADDLHGPCLGPDGRIYWGVGRFDYEIRVPGRPVLRKGKSPLVMRCRPDGQDVEVFCAAMGNPVEVAFSNEGEGFACGTFLAPESMGDGLRDAIIHCVLGGIYAVRDRNLHEDPRTGDLLPPLAHLGVAAGSGLTRAVGGSFGAEDGLDLYSGLFNLHQVEHHKLERSGASFTSQNEPLITSGDVDFHPTDVLEDADGSLLVVDTGAWFRSCPTSQIGQPRVYGGIYRIRKQGQKAPADPRGRLLTWNKMAPDELAQRLADDRFAVCQRAIAALARAGTPAVPALGRLLRESQSVRGRRNAVWGLARIGDGEARRLTRSALVDPESSVRLAAAVSVGLHRDREALADLLAMIDSPRLAERREAATALARLAQPEAVPKLLQSLRSSGGDPFLDHALIFALIKIGDRDATRAGLEDSHSRVRRGALIALGQMPGGALSPADVIPLLDPAEPDLQRAALQVVASHGEWAADMVPVFRRWIAEDRLDEAQRRSLRQELVAFCRHPAVQDLMVSALKSKTTPLTMRVLLLDTMLKAPLSDRPQPWLEALRVCLSNSDERVLRQAVAVVRSVGTSDFDDALVRLARDPARSEALRVEALEAASGRMADLDQALLELLLSATAVDKPALLRLTASRAIGQAKLNSGQLEELTGAVAQAGAFVLPRLIPAFERGDDPAVGPKLVAALAHSPGLRSLSADDLRRLFQAYPVSVQREAEALVSRLELDETKKNARLSQLGPQLADGDAKQGRDVFFSSRATCTTCHTIHSEGGHVGPDLSRIGAIRNRRDLLEAILYPSATFARGYEPYMIETEDGRSYTGVIHQEGADSLVLVTPDRSEVTIPRSSIQTMEQSRLSIMPRGLEANLSRQELASLIAYLESLR